MGKLAVVFFAALAFQAVLGRYTTGYGYDREEHNDLVQQLVAVSGEIYQTFHNLPLQRGFSWENREFGQEIEEIISYLEELTTKYDEQTSGYIYNVLRELRQVRSYFKELYTCTDKTAMRKLEISLANAIKKAVQYFESFEEQQYNGPSYQGYKTLLQKFVYALTNLYQSVNEHKTSYYSHESTYSYGKQSPEFYYGSSGNGIQEVARELEITLERVHFEDALMKRAFYHLVRRYFENLQEVLAPEYQQYYQMFFHAKDSTYSTQKAKTQIYNFIKSFVAKAGQYPPTTYVAFVKATLKFQSRLEIMNEINTPVRQLAIRIQAFADFITNGYENLPYQSAELKEKIAEHAQKFVGVLHSFIVKIEKTESSSELVAALKQFVARFEKNLGQFAIVGVIQDIATELRKFFIARPEVTEYKVFVGTEFYNVLEWASASFEKHLLPKGVEFWSSYLGAQTNKLSLYLHNDINSDDMKILEKHLYRILQTLEQHQSHPEYKKLAHSLKQTIVEFETEPYLINTFLQKISLDLDQFMWTIYDQNEHLPQHIYEIVIDYLNALEKIHYNQRVIDAYLTAQTPQEITVKAQTVVDRLTKMLHSLVPGYKQTKVGHRVRYFNQVLEIVMYRLRKIASGSGKSDTLVMEVYENLRQIQNHLERVLEQASLNNKVNFGVYVQNAYFELRKLAFEHRFEGHADFLKLYSDFLFGLRYLVNQVQFDQQMIVEQYSIKTLNAQIETVAHTISNYLQRIQPKPELKRVVLLQVEVLSQLVEGLASAFGKISGNPVFTELTTKYKQMYAELQQTSQTGWNKPIEGLCAFLDVHINTVARDLGRLTYYKQETPEFYDVYSYALLTFSNIMARLENVHYYEYYNIIVMTPNYASYVQRLTSHVTQKLQTPFGQSKEIKYDLALQALRFANRLETIVLRFQIEAKVFPKGLYGIIAGLQRVGSTQSVSVNELATKINQYVVAAYTEIGKIVDYESTVGVKEALIKYIVALERLYFNLHNILVRSHNDGSFQTIFTRIDTYVHYLIKAIEHVNTENKVAFNVLAAEYRRLIGYVAGLSSKLNEFSTSPASEFQPIFKKLAAIRAVETEHYKNVDELEVNIIESLKHVAVVLKELAWVLPNAYEYQGSSDANKAFKYFFDEFLTTVQYMHLEIETGVLLPQRSYNWNKWGLTQGRFAKNYGAAFYGNNQYTSKYDETYYGPFVKYFNKYGNKYSNAFGTAFGYAGKYSYPYTGQYESKYGFPGKYGSQNWENTPEYYKYGNNQYQSQYYGKNWASIPEQYGYSSKYGQNTPYTAKYGQKWENTPEGYGYGWESTPEGYGYGSQYGWENKPEGYGYNTEWKYGQNWEHAPQGYKYNTEWKYGQYVPQEYKYGSSKYAHAWGYAPEAHKYGHRYNTEWKYGQNWENTPAEYPYGSWENTPDVYKYGNNKYYGQGKYAHTWENTPSAYQYASGYVPSTYGYKSYKTPEYYGPYQHQYPSWYKYAGYKSANPKYSYGSEYDLPSFYKNIKNIAQEVAEYLKEYKQGGKYELTTYVRELVQFIKYVNNHFEQEDTKSYQIQHIVEKFQEIQSELEQLFGSANPGQAKYQLINAIEQIVDQFEKLAHIEQYNEVQFFKTIFAQFYNYIRSVKYHIQGNYQGYNTGAAYHSTYGTPFYGSSTYQKPFYGYSTYETPFYGSSSYGTPFYGSSAYQKPFYGYSTYGVVPKYNQLSAEQY